MGAVDRRPLQPRIAPGSSYRPTAGREATVVAGVQRLL
jgi:hypothetical protein